MDGVLGLRRGVVELRPWSPAYPRLFERERDRVLAALGALTLDVQHVGSTSVPGLMAKPVLDLAVAGLGADVMGDCVPPLEALGYEAFGDREGRGQLAILLRAGAGRGPDALPAPDARVPARLGE